MKERSAQAPLRNDASTTAKIPLTPGGRFPAERYPSHSLLCLQQTIGNQAVVRHLQKKGRIQRAAETGMASSAMRGRYTMGVSTWRNEHMGYNPPVQMFVLIDEAAEKARNLIGELGIPMPDKVLDPQAPGGLDGQFRANEWSLLLNPQMVAPLTTTLDALTNDQLVRIVNVVYHELRHCEQYYNMARFLAGTGIEAKEIATTMDIPERIAQSAHVNPLKMVVNNGVPFFGGGLPSISAEYFEAWQWYRQVYGKLGKYTKGIYEIVQDIWKLRGSLNDVIADPARADIAYDMDVIIQAWKDERIPKVLEAYKASLEASPFSFEMDKQALGDIKRILPVMKGFIEIWDQSSGDFAALKPELTRVNDVVKQAYEALLTEKDAHTLGDQVTDDFKTLAGI